ncbi:MAG: EamA family transporter [Spirochaetaceae bacterium]
MNRTIKNIIPILAIIAAVILWGCSFVGMRISLRSLHPLSVIWIRMVTALIVVLPFSKKLFPNNYLPGDWKLLLPMVLMQPCLYFLLESNALLLTTSSQAGVISATVPILVTLGAWIFLSEKINIKTILGLTLSVIGVVFLTRSQGSNSIAENPVLGNILEFTAMIFAAGNMLIIKKLSKRYNPWTLTFMQVLAGTMFFIPGLFKLVNNDINWTIQLISILLYLGVFVSLGAFGLYNWGISKVSASKASSYINLVPVMAIITGWLILGEGLNVIQIISAIVILFGVILSQRSLKSEPIHPTDI